jgi:hypothetical protein
VQNEWAIDESAAPPTRRLDSEQLVAVLPTGVIAPPALLALAARPDLQRRIRSVTGCYLDLGDVVVRTSVEGGYLVSLCSPISSGACIGWSTWMRMEANPLSRRLSRWGSSWAWTTGRNRFRLSFRSTEATTSGSAPTASTSSCIASGSRMSCSTQAAKRRGSRCSPTRLRSGRKARPVSQAHRWNDGQFCQRRATRVGLWT